MQSVLFAIYLELWLKIFAFKFINCKRFAESVYTVACPKCIRDLAATDTITRRYGNGSTNILHFHFEADGMLCWYLIMGLTGTK